MNERAEPRTAAGLRLYHGIAIRGLEHKALRDILAIEVEAAGLAVMAVDDDYGAAAAPQPSALRAAAQAVDDGWFVVDEGRTEVRLRYASDLPARLNALRAALTKADQ